MSWMCGRFAAGITAGLDVVTLSNQIPIRGLSAVHPSPAEILHLAITLGTFLGMR